MLPVVALVGRPNVGKSALFNRFVKKRYAIESKVAGTTRDRLYHTVFFHDYPVMLVDTAGLDFEHDQTLEADIQTQAHLAVDEADVILFVVDVTQPLTFADYSASEILRKRNKNVIVLANKADNPVRSSQAVHLYELGFEHVVAVSALHGHGLDEVSDVIGTVLRDMGISPVSDVQNVLGIKLAFLGKPNVGKSSLVNKILGSYRMLVSDMPGTTRDSTDSVFMLENDRYVLIDTAGIRRQAKVESRIEHYSLLRSLQSLSRCDVGLLILDASSGVTRQDLRVCQFILDEGKGLIILVNKSDLLRDQESEASVVHEIQRRFVFVSWAPVVFVSALTGDFVLEVFRLSKEIYLQRQRRIETPVFNRFLKKIMIQFGAAGSGGKIMKIYYGSQIDISPPTFVLFVNDPDIFHISFKRHLEKALRREFGFSGTAVRIEFRQRKTRS